MLSISSPAAAGDSLTAAPAPAGAGWAGHFLVRARATYLDMEGDVDKAHIEPPGPFFPLSGGVLPGHDAEVSDQWIPELDFSYFVNDHIALEAICCATKHTVDATGVLGDTINAVTGTGREVAETWAIPATILLQFHIPMGAFKPYVGAGPTYAIFVDSQVGRGLQPVASSVKVDDTWGVTGQFGADIAVGGNWQLNLDAKYMFLEPDVYWKGKGILAGRSLVADNLKLDPWILSVGLGYKF
jgi:outer membrane protein